MKLIGIFILYQTSTSSKICYHRFPPRTPTLRFEAHKIRYILSQRSRILNRSIPRIGQTAALRFTWVSLQFPSHSEESQKSLQPHATFSVTRLIENCDQDSKERLEFLDRSTNCTSNDWKFPPAVRKRGGISRWTNFVGGQPLPGL